MAETPQQIRSRPVPACRLCGTEGVVLYKDLPDRSYSAPGLWSFRRCPKPGCGLVWLDPEPITEDIGLAYQGYYTHNQPAPGPSVIRDTIWAIWMSYLGSRFGYTQGVGPGWRKLFAPLAMLHPGGRQELDAAAMYLPAPHRPARVLDVGCGSGVLLERMQKLGWQVEGVELDPGGVEAARRRGVTVRQGTLEEQQYPDNSFDAVHSAHVIEHVPDPVALLAECRRILKPGGTLVFITPNIESHGHQQFKSAWLNLDPPRHLVLFSAATLRAAAEKAGLQVALLDSSSRSAWVYGAMSRLIQQTGRAEISELGKPANLLNGIRYQLGLRWTMRGNPGAGDELRLFATKK